MRFFCGSYDKSVDTRHDERVGNRSHYRRSCRRYGRRGHGLIDTQLVGHVADYTLGKYIVAHHAPFGMLYRYLLGAARQI